VTTARTKPPRPVTSILEALEPAAERVTRSVGEVLAAVSALSESAQELSARTAAHRRLTALAEAWETEAAHLRAVGGTGAEAAVVAGVLEERARQLRGALAYGGTE